MEEFSSKENMIGAGVETKNTQVSASKQKDTTSDYFAERAKKLVTAVYLVTNLIPNNDPLRMSARELSIKLLSYMGLTPEGQSVSQISTEARNLSKKISEFLEIAFFSGYISEMNYSVLKTEFDLFANEVAGYDGSQGVLESASLQPKLLPEVTSSRLEQKISGYSGHSGQKTKTQVNPAKTIATGAFSHVKPLKSIQVKSTIEAKKTSRKESILSIIRMKGSVGIKDVSSVILDCSEKTIQRELQALVKEGMLKKSGDRRWSTYTLA